MTSTMVILNRDDGSSAASAAKDSPTTAARRSSTPRRLKCSVTPDSARSHTNPSNQIPNCCRGICRRGAQASRNQLCDHAASRPHTKPTFTIQRVRLPSRFPLIAHPFSLLRLVRNRPGLTHADSCYTRGAEANAMFRARRRTRGCLSEARRRRDIFRAHARTMAASHNALIDCCCPRTEAS